MPTKQDINGTQTDSTYRKNTPTVDPSKITTFPIGADSTNRPTVSQLTPPALTHSVVKPSDAVRHSNLASITSSRSDFLERVQEQIHDYLQASGSPHALTHRPPSASQLYLTTGPTAGQSHLSNVPEPLLEAQPLLAESHPLTAGLSTDNSSKMGALTNAAHNDTVQPAIEASNVAMSPAFEDNLPQLAPAQPIDFTASPTIVQTDESEPSEEASIGTVILQNLQRSANVSGRPPVALTPTFTARVSDDGPTLARLLQTMPRRELSPLIANRQNANESTQSTQPAAWPSERSGAATITYAAPAHTLYSPQPAGLNAAEVQAIVYVPAINPAINPTPSHLSKALSQKTAIRQDLSTAISIDEISFQNVFFPKLTLAALLGSETTTAPKPKAMPTLPSTSQKTPEKAISHPQKTQTAPQVAPQVFGSKRFLSDLTQSASEHHQLTTQTEVNHRIL